MKLRLTDFDSNTYEDTDGSCELCMWTGMMDHPVYEFTDSYGGVHTVEGWTCDWGHMTIYNINVPMFTTWLHDVEFKEPAEVARQLGLDCLDGERFWEAFLYRIIADAQYCSTAEGLNEALYWALKGETNVD